MVSFLAIALSGDGRVRRCFALVDVRVYQL